MGYEAGLQSFFINSIASSLLQEEYRGWLLAHGTNGLCVRSDRWCHLVQRVVSRQVASYRNT